MNDHNLLFFLFVNTHTHLQVLKIKFDKSFLHNIQFQYNIDAHQDPEGVVVKREHGWVKTIHPTKDFGFLRFVFELCGYFCTNNTFVHFAMSFISAQIYRRAEIS